MSLNNEYRFGAVPTMKWPRTIFKMKSNFKGTFNVGKLIPFYVQQQILPGDTYEFKQSIVCRSQVPLQPTMDDLVMDVYYFFIPKRLVWDNFKKFMGENTSGAWTMNAALEEPQVIVDSSTTPPVKGSLWDYFGLPIGIKSATAANEVSVSSLPFRAYWLTYSTFFRNQNLIAPKLMTNADSNSQYQTLNANGYSAPANVSKLPDYFTTALPEPQKSPNGAIKMPLGTSAPVKGNGKAIGLTDGTNNIGLTSYQVLAGDDGNTIYGSTGNYNKNVGDSATTGPITNNKVLGLTTDGEKSGMYVDLTNATAATINALRLMVQTQKIYELDGLFGTRYFDEILYGHFGVTSGAAQYEKVKFLGAKRIPIVMNQVAQTSSTDSTSPLGQPGAFSLTVSNDRIFKQSFTEHGIILGLLTIRQLNHTTQQGISRQWKMRNRLDYFWHEFEHLGNQPIYNYEIYADGTSTDYEVFGYQERYAEYRFEENRITGEFRSTYTTPLDSWHYGDKYNSLPVLNKTWIEETDANVKRTLAVQNKDQFWIDTTMYINAVRPLSPFGTPGLVDHL